MGLECNKAVDGNITLFTGKSVRNSFSDWSFPVLDFSLPFVPSFRSPEPHILLFRRPLGTDPQSGRVDPELQRKAREEYRAQYGNRK